MELRDARKINSKELYDRRKQAVLLFEKGLKRYEIAPLVGVSAYTKRRSGRIEGRQQRATAGTLPKVASA